MRAAATVFTSQVCHISLQTFLIFPAANCVCNTQSRHGISIAIYQLDQIGETPFNRLDMANSLPGLHFWYENRQS